MNASSIIAAEEVVAVGAYTATELVGSEEKGLPSPRIIVGTLLFYGMLSWVSALGREPARIAAAVGGVVALLIMLRQPVLLATQSLAQNLEGLFSTSATQGGGTQ